jgi:hypothetical protein
MRHTLPRGGTWCEKLDTPALPYLPLAQLDNLPVVTSQG